MSTNEKKSGLLSSSLDFEGVEGMGVEMDDWLQSDKPTANAADEKTSQNAMSKPADFDPALPTKGSARRPPPVAQSKVSLNVGTDKAAAERRRSPAPSFAHNKTGKSKEKSLRHGENFSFYLGVGIVIGLFLMSWIAYAIIRSNSENSPELSYVALPEATFNLDGKVVRLEISVQTDQNDREWAKEHKKILNDAFNLAVTNIAPDELSNAENIPVLQEKLKSEINKIVSGDHVTAVLITGMLTQDEL